MNAIQQDQSYMNAVFFVSSTETKINKQDEVYVYVPDVMYESW